MGIEGSITLDLHWDGRSIRRAVVRSTRPLMASRLLQGKPWQAAEATVPLLFSICGRAQAVAAAGAIEAARGAAPDEGVTLQRELLVAAECVQEFAWRVLLDLPALLGVAPQTQQFAALRRELQAALPGGGVQSPWWHQAAAGEALGHWQRVALHLAQMLEAQVFGMAGGDWLALPSPAQLTRWMEQGATPAAQSLARLWPSALGRGDVQLLPRLTASEWARELGERIAGSSAFAAAPTWRDAPAETGALSRSADEPLVGAALRELGNTAAVRLLARLAELARLAQRLAALGRGEIGVPWSGGARLGAGAGFGAAETARGILLHFVQLDGEGRVASYRIVAPTEWNFHPEGAFVRGMAGVAARSPDAARQAAALMAHALDPCVAYRIEVIDA